MCFGICTRLSFESYPSVPIITFKTDWKHMYQLPNLWVVLETRIEIQFNIFQMRKQPYYSLRSLVTKLLGIHTYTDRHYLTWYQAMTAPRAPRMDSQSTRETFSHKFQCFAQECPLFIWYAWGRMFHLNMLWPNIKWIRQNGIFIRDKTNGI